MTDYKCPKCGFPMEAHFWRVRYGVSANYRCKNRECCEETAVALGEDVGEACKNARIIADAWAQKNKPRTIADKLRSMTDEELAGALEATHVDSICDVCEGKHGECDANGPHGSERCKERILAYLRTPLTEEKEEKPMQEMTLNEYQRLAQRTSSSAFDFDDFRTLALKKIDNGILGLCGEAGECSDLWKKHKHQGHKLDPDKLADECGDVLWYVAELAAGLGLTLEEIARRNVAKLEKRYPKGHFEAERSINREE